MKKLITILITIIFLTTQSIQAFALTPTAAVTPETSKTEQDEKLINQINTLKEKVASKVAELRLVEKHGIIGTVSDVSGNKITVNDLQDKTRYIDVDELTKFSSPTAKGSFGISDISKGMNLGVTGLYNKQSRRILARFIDVVVMPQFISGVIADVDKVNYTVTVKTESNTEKVIDIENITKTSIYTEEDGVNKAGFSKLEVGKRAFVMGYASKTDNNRITGTRIIEFSELPTSPKIVIPQASSDSEEKATATPTKKATR
jgi:hypothetical protein